MNRIWRPKSNIPTGPGSIPWPAERGRAYFRYQRLRVIKARMAAARAIGIVPDNDGRHAKHSPLAGSHPVGPEKRSAGRVDDRRILSNAG